MTEKKVPEKKAPEKKTPAKKVAGPLESCPQCGKRVSSRGMRGHILFVHKPKETPDTKAPETKPEPAKTPSKSKTPAKPAPERDATPEGKTPEPEKVHWYFRKIGGRK